MLRSMGRAFASLAKRFVPDPFVLAILLTFLTYILCVVFQGYGLSPVAREGQPAGALPGYLELLVFWGDERGFWSLLDFGMQMCLILVTGYALATAPLVRRWIRRWAGIPRTTAAAAGLTAAVAITASFVQWGLGLIVGALFARAVGEEAAATGRKIDYPLVGAAGYAGLLVWHGGISGSAPIKVTRAEDLERMLGPELAERIGPIPLQDTIGSTLNLVVAILLLLLVPAFFALLAPRKPEDRPMPTPSNDETSPPESQPSSLAGRLEESRILAWAIGGMGLTYLQVYVMTEGIGHLDPNPINMFFLSVGIILHGSPKRYAQAIGEGVKGCAGIILQFPFYFGIMGMMQRSGLAARIASSIAEGASEATYPLLTFASAAVVNLFVPSGGGQWAVQGPIVLESALDLQIPPGKAVMAFAYGDQWTNMIQPFWALALLGITGLKARDILGYTAAVMLMTAPIFCLPLLFL